LTPSATAATPTFDPAAERAAALFVIGRKGTLTVTGGSGTISTADKIPAENFSIRSISMPDSAGISDGELRVFARLSQLSSLSLNKQNITDAGLVYLANLRNLQSLGLGGARVSDRGLAHLAGLTNLRTLVLYGSRVSDEGLKTLAPLTKLAHLNVHNCVLVSDDSVDLFLSLPELRTVSAPATGITAKGVARLKAARPGFQITWDSPPEPLRADDYALRFGGKKSAAKVELPLIDFVKTPSFTIEGYCRPQNTEYGHFATSFFRIPLGTNGWALVVRQGGRGDLAITDEVKPESVTVRTHVAAVFAPDEMRLFLDGRHVATREIDLAIALRSIAPPVLGEGLNAVLDEVRISDVARYESDFVPERYFTPDEQTLALYHCDEGAGDVLKDSSGHGRDGRIVGATWVRADGSPIAAP
jgi:hypothetical protein